jgi:NhaA family Na+:H+ antiporter
MGAVQTTSEGRHRGRVLFAVVAPFEAFFRLEAAGGLVLLANAVLALAWANSRFRGIYEGIFHAPIEMKLAGRGIDLTVHQFTNDALMTLFFVVAGLEIKRELAQGELRTRGRAALPLIAAAGGMVAPALIYLALNPTGPARAGWGVPMATDIAFALGCLSLVRRRVPPSVFVFLTALAIFDDLGSIAVIALFYGGRMDAAMLVVALLLSAILVLLGRLRVQALWSYVVVGVLLWASVLDAGGHATIAGVVIGLSLPTVPRQAPRDVLDDLDIATTTLRRDLDRRGVPLENAVTAVERHVRAVQSPLHRMMHALHGVVAFGVVPLFALANAGVSLSSGTAVGSNVTLGTFLGLSVGKPIGVLGATWAATRFGVAPRPTGAGWIHLVAVSLMAGIGFTMSLLVGNLGLGHTRGLEDQAKLGVLMASALSAALGLALLLRFSPPSNVPEESTVPVVLDVPRFAPGFGVRPCEVTEALAGHALTDLDVRRRFGVTIVGFWRAGKEVGPRNLEPVPVDYPMRAGDVLLVVGTDEAVEGFLTFAESSDGPEPVA